MPPVGTIVVGVDGSEGSLQALRWALDEARLRGARLVAVHAWFEPYAPAMPGVGEPSVVPVDRDLIAQAADEGLEASLREVGTSDAGPEIERAVVEETPARALLDQAEGADLLVVGSRGHGRIAGALLGSISQQVAQHAPCPVVIVRPQKAD
jgi:nucleotide-binding universal stress UspA family protein